MRTWTEDRGIPHFIMDMIWQMLQSIDTTSLNVTKDFEELWDMAQETGWLGPAKPRTLWTEEEDEEITFTQMPSAQVTKMEGIMTFAAEWCTTNEVVILRCVSASLFVVVNEWPDDAVVSEMIKHLPLERSLEKIYIIRRCFHERFLGQMDAPNSWKIVKLVFLRKSDAEPKKVIRSCGAIALTSVMSKWYASLCDDAHGKGERARDLEKTFIWEESTG